MYEKRLFVIISFTASVVSKFARQFIGGLCNFFPPQNEKNLDMLWMTKVKLIVVVSTQNAIFPPQKKKKRGKACEIRKQYPNINFPSSFFPFSLHKLEETKIAGKFSVCRGLFCDGVMRVLSDWILFWGFVRI